MPIDQELMNKLRENTEVNMKIRKNKETVDKTVKVERMKVVMDKITEDITSNCVDTMLKASDEGYYYATIYKYTNNDTVGGFKTVFLIKGPLNSGNNVKNGVDYFEELGIEPIINRINSFVAPMYCFHKYDRVTKEHYMIVSWKPN